jgi:hypothetical protein
MTLPDPVPKVAAAPEAMVDAVGVVASSLGGNDAEKEDLASNSSIKDSDASPTPPNEKSSIKDGEPDNSQQDLVQHEPPAHLTGIKLVTVCVSVMLAVLCIALDNTSQWEYYPIHSPD